MESTVPLIQMENFLGNSFKLETSGHRIPAPVADTILSTWPLASQTWSNEVSTFIITESCKGVYITKKKQMSWEIKIKRMIFRVSTYHRSLCHATKVIDSFLQKIHSRLNSTDVDLRIDAVDFLVETQKDVKGLGEVIRQRRLAERF